MGFDGPPCPRMLIMGTLSEKAAHTETDATAGMRRDIQNEYQVKMSLF